MIRIPDREMITPWTIPDIEVLMTHLCNHGEERAIPERLALQTTERMPDPTALGDRETNEEAQVESVKTRNDQLRRMMIARA
jgi:hypothetical protein